MSVYDWSTTSADNDDADGNINWLEGQASNTVNNSARAMMAAVAAYLQQTNSTIATGGAANAYTVTSPTGFAFTAYAAGMTLSFKANHTNTGAATLNVDGLGAKAIKKGVSTALAAGDIVINTIITLVYDGTNFQLKSQPAGDSFDSGTSMVFHQTAAPTGWTKDTTANLNNTALRVTTGTISSRTIGDDFTTAFAAAKSSNAGEGGSTTGGTAATINNTNLSLSVSSHTLTESELPSHRHYIMTNTAGAGANPTDISTTTSLSPSVTSHSNGNWNYILNKGGASDATIGRSSATGSDSGHTHGLSGSTANHNHSSPSHTHTTPDHTHTTDLDVNYHDVIICTKD